MEALRQVLGWIRVIEIVDLVVVWILVWAGIAWLRTTQARRAMIGLGFLVIGYLVARQLGLVLTTWILQGFGAVAALIVVVVFQQDLRRLFEQIAAFGLRRELVASGPDVVDTLARAMVHLAGQHRGALVVIPGHEAVDGHVEGGLELDAIASEPLLLSLFDPNSAGHDGAAIFAGGRILRFAVHLPLSTDHAQLGQRGTRHAAALGLAERCDALCIVVSEERGTISIAHDAKLRTLATPQRVVDEIQRFLGDLAPTDGERSPRLSRMLARWREGLLALPVAALLWALAVPGASMVEVEREVPVSVSGLPPGFVVEHVEPERVRVVLGGRRRDLFLLAPDALSVRVDAILAELGRRTFTLTPENVSHPENTEVHTIQPDSIKISIKERKTAVPAPKNDLLDLTP